jgi:hypothetical protein
MSLISTFLPLIAFFVAVGLLSANLDSVARRVAPDLVSGARRQKAQAPRGALAWTRLIATSIIGVLAMILWIRGSTLTRYALIALISANFAWLGYKGRLRPLFERGASPNERRILFAWTAVAVASLVYVLLQFAKRFNAG